MLFGASQRPQNDFIVIAKRIAITARNVFAFLNPFMETLVRRRFF